MSRRADTPVTADPEVPGLHLRHVLTGHRDWISRLAWSPDGRTLASGSDDSTARLWDLATGRELHTIDHEAPVWGLAWSPDGTLLTAGMGDGRVQISAAATGRRLRRLRVLDIGALGSTILAVAWSPDGRTVVSGGFDGTLRRWDAEYGREIELLASGEDIYDLCPSPDGKILACCGSSGTIRLWDVQSWQVHQELAGHTGAVFRIAWSPQGQRLASASLDGTVRLWDPAAGTMSSILEAHTNGVTSVSFSADGGLLASNSVDRTVRLWRTDSLATVAVLRNAHGGWVGSTAAFHPSAPLLASFGADDPGVIRLWDLDLATLLGRAPAEEPVSYATAKVVLVGEAGVGKTALGWRLAHGEFRDHPSTHGQQFWALGALDRRRADGTECEAILWDLAGQPDYRLIHALFLDDADLALVLFNPADRQEPLRGVDFWLKALGHRADRRIPTILVGARTDRGDSTLTPAEIEAFCRDRGISGGYVATSALTEQGCGELVERMRDQVDWDRMPATVTTATFKRIKEYVLGLKEGADRQEILTDARGLRRRLEAFAPDWEFSDEEMMTAVGHLAKHGYVQLLRTAAGEPVILLVPELLNNLAASFVLEARRNPRGLGALDEQRILAGSYPFPELEGLETSQREILLDSATALFLAHNVCFRESLGPATYLVFPELINQKKPRTQGEVELEDDVSYTVSGAVENVYAALVVLLGYTSIFTRTDQWQNQAEYEVGSGEVCGFYQAARAEGEIELVLYYAAAMGGPTRGLFQGLFERFLTGRDLNVIRYPILVCPACGYRQERASVVRRTRERRGFLFCDDCGHKIPLPAAGEPVALSREQRQVVDREQATAGVRTRFETTLVRVKAMARDRPQGPSCFVSYAWDGGEAERWVEKNLAADLKNAGIEVILDRWHNAAIGANVPRFASRIEGSDWILVVGTPLYRQKYENGVSSTGSMVAAEVDLINVRLTGTEEQKKTVLPLLLAGSEQESLPPLLHRRVYADFRSQEAYFFSLLDLILTLYGIGFDQSAVRDLRDYLRDEDGRRAEGLRG